MQMTILARRYKAMGLSMQDVLFLGNDVSLKNEELSINNVKLSPQELAELIAAIKDGTISGKIGKQEFDPEKCITDFLLMCDICCSLQITDPVEMEKMVMKVFSKSPKQLEQYRSGRTKLQGFFCWPEIEQSRP
ncbi:hypothetical protein HID58_074924 [Brassica napus]|uniref:Asn/Gln amidotransferase domain-containing protein n=1 Tax=Brassica napus TaxID=3708 RepID=A0ABQ7YI91_BRANA|nr:hypothetical protein HID58_074924 [Brassica napus]